MASSSPKLLLFDVYLHWSHVFMADKICFVYVFFLPVFLLKILLRRTCTCTYLQNLSFLLYFNVWDVEKYVCVCHRSYSWGITCFETHSRFFPSFFSSFLEQWNVQFCSLSSFRKAAFLGLQTDLFSDIS